jgi:serine/alanine adding enzyme
MQSAQKAPHRVSGGFYDDGRAVMAVSPEILQSQCRVEVLETPGSDWDAFVMGFPDSSIYHLSGWTEIARQVFGHRALFVESRDSSGSLLGVLPVIRQRSWLLGNFATSLAFFNYGGVLARDPLVAQQMMIRAAEAAEALGCRYLEFRDIRPRLGEWVRRTDKVTLRVDLPDTIEALSKGLGSKLRSQVKRAEREGVQCKTGSAALLDDLVFAENMRDLGTPVYPKRFFEAILQRYEQYCQLVVIESQGEPWAAAFLVFWRGGAEVPWASCRAKAKPLGANMKLYWELLSEAIGRGCKSFDFGRSTVDSGTDRFKRQWGAEPVPLHWYRWERHGEAPGGDERGGAMSLATAMWRRLPLGIANTLGPLISGALPW